MRIIQVLIITFFTLLVGVSSYNFGYTACSGTDDRSAVEFLQDCSDGMQNAISNSSIDGTNGMQILITSIAEKVIAFGALFAIGAIVFSGIQYTTSYGDDEKVKKAKTTGIYALIGLFLLLLAFPLVNIVVRFIYGLGG